MAPQMGISINWLDDEKRIIISEYSGKWTVSDVYQMLDATRTLVDSVKHSVDLIIVYRDSEESVGKFVDSLTPEFITHFNDNISDNQRLVVMVNASLLLKKTFKLLSKMMPNFLSHLLYAISLEEALEIIEQHTALNS